MTTNLEIPDWLNSTLASDAAGGEGAMQGLSPLRPGQLYAGYATTVTVAEGDNLELREVIRAGAGDARVLVIAGSPNSHGAVMGDLMARWAENRGFLGAILDGRVRDAAVIRTLNIQFWCRGVTPVAAEKRGGGRVGGAAHCAAVTVNPGDLVIADDDGVVVWPAARIPELLRLARERLDSDLEKTAELAAGKDLT